MSEINETPWINVKESGNPKKYICAWVYTEDGRVEEDTFHPEEVGRKFSSNVWEGVRESDGWYHNGTNLPGEKVTHYIVIEPPKPPKLLKEDVQNDK